MRIALALISSLAASLALAADAGPWNRVSSDALRGHTEFLADDLLEGRAAATRGYDLAAAYVAAQFRQYGLKPAGDAGTYFQHVPLVEATPVLPGSSARLVLENDTTGAQTEKHQKRMMSEVAKLVEGSKMGTGYLDPADYERTVNILLSVKSDPVITKKPEGAWTHAVFEASKKYIK